MAEQRGRRGGRGGSAWGGGWGSSATFHAKTTYGSDGRTVHQQCCGRLH
jgi:hypothetical protein